MIPSSPKPKSECHNGISSCFSSAIAYASNACSLVLLMYEIMQNSSPALSNSSAISIRQNLPIKFFLRFATTMCVTNRALACFKISSPTSCPETVLTSAPNSSAKRIFLANFSRLLVEKSSTYSAIHSALICEESRLA